MRHSSYLVAVAAGCMTFLAGAASADSPSPTPSATDAEITQRVMGKLSVDDPTLARLLQVSTKDGVVTLSGLAYTGADALKALRDARSVAGVTKVRNRMSLQQ